VDSAAYAKKADAKGKDQKYGPSPCLARSWDRNKAMAGLIHDAREGRLGRDDTVVFLHTGGLPAVFA
jgi:hypothetical protein